MNTTLLKRMLQISREMAQTRDLDTLLQLAMEETLVIVNAEIGYLLILSNSDHIEFKIRAGNHMTLDDETDTLSRSILDDVIRAQTPLVITDALSDERYGTSSSVQNLQIRSVMCVPLISHGETLGAIYVENRTISGAFRQEDLEPFIFFANQASASIENVMIIATLETRVAERTAQLEQSWQEAVEANKIRTTLLGQLAHDMRSPATVINLSLQMLENPKVSLLNDQQYTWVSRSSMALQQMINLIQNIFELSKHELQSLEIHKEPIDLKDFLLRMVEIATGLPWEEAVEFRHEIPDDLPTIDIDPVRIQQVVMNLISNALKFTATGEVVLYATMPKPSSVHIGVRDTGIGMPSEVHEKVFERFQQYDADTARQSKGAGLGLAICKELVEQHGGRIWVESTPAVGSDFVFVISTKVMQLAT